jgi:hypothetical protein
MLRGAVLALAFGTTHSVRVVKKSATAVAAPQTQAPPSCPAFVVNPVQRQCGGPPPAFELDAPVYCGAGHGRICEIVEPVPGSSGHVWNTLGCNECPGDVFSGIGIGGKVGPTYMTMDYGRSYPPAAALDADGNRIVKTYTGKNGGLDFMKVAILDQPFPKGSHTFMQMGRQTLSRWRPGRQVYQLVLPDMEVFTMFFSKEEFTPQFQQIIASLPVGWSFRCKVVGCGGLELRAPGDIANVTRDTLTNLYEWTPPEVPSACPRYLNRSCAVENAATRSQVCANPPAECGR